jgi:hypothetical protein
VETFHIWLGSITYIVCTFFSGDHNNVLIVKLVVGQYIRKFWSFVGPVLFAETNARKNEQLGRGGSRQKQSKTNN